MADDHKPQDETKPGVQQGSAKPGDKANPANKQEKLDERLDELFRIADEVTVMRDGRTIGTHPMSNLTVREIAEMMGVPVGTVKARIRSALRKVRELAEAQGVVYAPSLPLVQPAEERAP